MTKRTWLAGIGLGIIVTTSSAQAQFCQPSRYFPRAPAAEKFTSWYVNGAYDVHIATAGEGTHPFDLDGDGRKELLVAGFPGATWQAHGFVSGSRGFEIVEAARSPVAYDPTSFLGTGWISSGTLTAGGPTKLVMGSDFKVYNAATRDLEVVGGGLDPGLGRVWTVDIDHDGTIDVVSEGGVVLDGALTRYKSLGHSQDGTILGNFDADRNYELMAASGALLEWRDGGWHEEHRISTESNRDLVMERGDVDADGVDELVYVIDGRFIRVYDFVERRQLWEAEVLTARTREHEAIGAVTNGVLRSGLTVADITDDGAADVLVVTEGHPADPGEVQAFNGVNGTKLWDFTHEDFTAGGIFVDNFDDDPEPDLLFATGRPITGPDRLHVYDLQTRTRKWMQRQESAWLNAVAIGELHANAGAEIITAPPRIIGENDTRFYVRSLDRMQVLDKLESANLPDTFANGVQALAIADVYGDGNAELIVGTDDASRRGRVYVYSWPARELLRTFELPGNTTVTHLDTADTDGDGELEVVAGTGVNAAPHLFILDARSGAIEWDSGPLFTDFGTLPALKVADLTGDGRPELIATGRNLLVVDGVTRQIAVISNGPYYGLDVLDATNDGVLDIVVGRAIDSGIENNAGRLEVFAGPGWTAQPSMQVCDDSITAIAANPFETSRKQVFFTCRSHVGVVDFSSRTWQTVTQPIGVDTGRNNRLHALRNASGEARLVVSGRYGLYSLAQTANLPPYLSGRNACSPYRFLKHWRNSSGGATTFSDPDGDELSMSIARYPPFSGFEAFQTDGYAQLGFDARPFKGADIFGLKVSDGTSESPLVLAALFVTNAAPSIQASSLTAQSGTPYRLSLPQRDSDDDSVEYEVVSAPAHGTLEQNSFGEVVYTASAEYVGADSFQLRARDAVEASEIATFMVQVEAAPGSTPPPPPTPPPTPDPTPSPSAPNGSKGGGGSISLSILFVLLALVFAHRRRLRRMSALR